MRLFVFCLLFAACGGDGSLADAGPCGSLSCAEAMYENKAGVHELSRESCLRAAKNATDERVCERAFVLARLGEETL
jgi:hypothetical protein